MASRKNSHRARPRNAVLLIDYTNVFGVISQHTDNDQPDAVVLDLVASLKRHVSEHLHLRPVRSLAFANLPPGNTRGHRATGAWLQQGIEPRFSYARSRDEASAIDMAMEAMDLSNELGPNTAFVLLSGNQWFVPLVQRLFGRGHFVLMATLESPTESDDLPAPCQDLYLNAEFLLGGPGRGLERGQGPQRSDVQSESHRPEETYPVDHDGARHTLEIIESYFGQYEEIYLTPLLRKLSEVMDAADEPKVLINELEKAGAVWLEKRRGFPHNYTVLLMNTEHPDVAEIKAASPAASDGYDDDAYDKDLDEYANDDYSGDHYPDNDFEDDSYDDYDEEDGPFEAEQNERVD